MTVLNICFMLRVSLIRDQHCKLQSEKKCGKSTLSLELLQKHQLLLTSLKPFFCEATETPQSEAKDRPGLQVLKSKHLFHHCIDEISELLQLPVRKPFMMLQLKGHGSSCTVNTWLSKFVTGNSVLTVSEKGNFIFCRSLINLDNPFWE